MEEYKRPYVDRWYEAFFLNSPNAIIFVREADGIVVDVNKAAEALLGYSYEELTHNNLTDIIIGMENQHIEAVSRSNGLSKNKSGDIMLCEISSSRVMIDNSGYMAMVMRNIGEGSYLKEIADNFPDILIKLNTRGCAEYISPSCKKILGYEPVSLIGRRVYDNIHNDDMFKALKTFYEVINIKRKLKAEFRYKRADDEYIWLEAVVSPVYDENNYYDGVIAVCRDITERKKTEERIRYLAYHDSLTGLPNRKTIDDTLKELINDAQSKKTMFSIMFIDLDNFKGINDTFGHDAGDIILKEVAKRLRSLENDSRMTARLGGDEFIIIDKYVLSEETCIKSAMEVADLFNTGIIMNGREIPVHLSMGISIYPEHGKDIRTLKRNADMAMYTAKRRRGNSYEIFKGGISEEAV